MAKINRIISIIIFSFLFFSCTKNDKIKLDFLSGYIAWKQNDRNKAVSKFLTIIDTTEEIRDEEIKQYADFAVGSIYLMQNEDVSALLRFENIKNCEDAELNSYIYYQKGIIAFKDQNYAKAVMLFKKSLELKPDSIDAKINFELSMRYLKKQKDKTQNNSQPLGVMEHKEDSLSEKTILNLIRKKEKEQWENKMVESKTLKIFDY